MRPVLALSGIVGASWDEVKDSLRNFASLSTGSLEKDFLSVEDDDSLVAVENAFGTTILYPPNFSGWQDSTEFLSGELNRVAFGFFSINDVSWGYSLYDDALPTDQFATNPGSFMKSKKDWKIWKGVASEITDLIPTVREEQISKYLIWWNSKNTNPAERPKAYPTDKYCYGDRLQLLDFIHKIGFEFPLDAEHEPLGPIYRFICGSQESDE